MLLLSRETDPVSPARLALQTVLAELPPELPLGILRALRVTVTQRLQLFNLNDLDSAAVRLTSLRIEATTIAGGALCLWGNLPHSYFGRGFAARRIAVLFNLFEPRVTSPRWFRGRCGGAIAGP